MVFRRGTRGAGLTRRECARGDREHCSRSVTLLKIEIDQGQEDKSASGVDEPRHQDFHDT